MALTIALLIAAATTLFAAGAPVSWLDSKAPAGWNVAGAAFPQRPGPRDAELVRGGRCAATLRPPSTREDRTVVRGGWSLVGAYHRYGPTAVVLATSSADGMCRPNGFQAFVFVNGAFAGTLSPRLMDSRTDGSISNISVTLDSAHDIQADFARYSAADALCCPHATSSVLYRVTTGPRPRVVPLAVTTHANPGG